MWYTEHHKERLAQVSNYYAEHREEKQSYRATRREQIRVYNAKYLVEHPEIRRANKANYKHRKRANGGTFPRASWEHLKALFGHCCAYCKRRMERLTQDHVIPISKGGWHFSGNIVPACQSCNSRKNNRIFVSAVGV